MHSAKELYLYQTYHALDHECPMTDGPLRGPWKWVSLYVAGKGTSLCKT
jgi:hypothetical protein